MDSFALVPYDHLAERLSAIDIELTDGLYYAMLEYAEYTQHISFAWFPVLEAIKNQGIDVTDWRCGICRGTDVLAKLGPSGPIVSPTFLGLIFPQGEIYIARRNE